MKGIFLLLFSREKQRNKINKCKLVKVSPNIFQIIKLFGGFCIL